MCAFLISETGYDVRVSKNTFISDLHLTLYSEFNVDTQAYQLRLKTYFYQK
jgi:hypothetical protein